MSSTSEDQIVVTQTTPVDEEVKAAPSSPKKQEADKTHASSENSEAKKEQGKPTTVRIARDSSMRRIITYVMASLSAGSVVTLQALTLQVERAINVASICRDRIGNVHQVNSLLVVEESVKQDESEKSNPRSTSGIQIVLSLAPLNEHEVGYQKPKPKGYARQHFLQRRQNAIRRSQARQESTHLKDAKQQASEGRVAKASKDRVAADPVAPADGDKPKVRRRRRAPSTSQPKKTEDDVDKNGPDRKSQSGEDPKQPKKNSNNNRRNSRRRRSKTTDKKEVEVKDVRSDNQKPQKRRSASKKKVEEEQTKRPQSRQSNRRRKSVNERDTFRDKDDSDFDVDHLGRRVPVRRDNFQSGRNQPRPPLNANGRRVPYQHGQSHRYMMDYNEQDEYFEQYAQGYGRQQQQSYYGNRNQPNYRMGNNQGPPARVGYFPAQRPQNPDQLMSNFPDRPRNQPRRGGYNNTPGF